MTRLSDVVERIIDSAIRTFDPFDAASYEHWDAELRKLEEAMSSIEVPKTEDLLALREHRIALASESGRPETVLDLSAMYLGTAPPHSPGYSNVALVRVKALHCTGDHEAEVTEGLSFSRLSALRGSGLLFLVEGLVKRHPGKILPDDPVWAKCRNEMAGLLEDDYLAFPPEMKDMTIAESEAGLLQAAAAVRQVFRAKELKILSNPDD